MTRHLGNLGMPRPQLDCTFGWFGSTIRTNPDVSPELELTEFMQRASQINIGDNIDAENVRPEDLAAAAGAMDTVVSFLRQQIHPGDWDEFWRLAKTNRQTIQDLMGVAMELIEVASGFPSTRPSSSQVGRSRTRRKSKGGSSKPARLLQGQAEAQPAGLPANPVATRALHLVYGRPDLQAAIVRAQEARSAVAEEAIGRRASA